MGFVDGLNVLNVWNDLNANLEESFLLQLSYDAVIDEIFSPQLANFFVAHAQEPDGVIDAIDIWIYPPLIDALHDFIAFFRLLLSRDVKPLHQARHHRRLVGRLLKECDCLNHGTDDFFHRSGRSIDKTSPG